MKNKRVEGTTGSSSPANSGPPPIKNSDVPTTTITTTPPPSPPLSHNLPNSPVTPLHSVSLNRFLSSVNLAFYFNI
ncbi:hypothetical protein L6452_20887 [Arctium lappa]|uniref:Uncharacterized protein n=1 Tax=Arctium lappa TaxID=4217 RepID=A0ACB9BH32_ARCLA|nr:hypothetical protein L6452_20887 [Arctium lappa]